MEPERKLLERANALGDELRRAFPGRLYAIHYAAPKTVKVDWLSPASADEEARLKKLLGEWNWSPRRVKTREQIVNELKRRPSLVARSQDVIIEMAASLLAKDPGLLRRAGEDYDGDEDDV